MMKIKMARSNIYRKNAIFKLPLFCECNFTFLDFFCICNKGNNKMTELRTILQRESQNS